MGDSVRTEGVARLTVGTCDSYIELGEVDLVLSHVGNDLRGGAGPERRSKVRRGSGSDFPRIKGANQTLSVPIAARVSRTASEELPGR